MTPPIRGGCGRTSSEVVESAAIAFAVVCASAALVLLGVLLERMS